MANITTIKRWIKAFFLPMVILAFSCNAASFADSSDSETPVAETSGTHVYISEMETAIADYKKIAENGGWPAFVTGKTIKAGDEDERIPTIRHILTVMGDYKEEQSDSKILDEALMEGVKNFQTRHGLDSDGALGKKTQAALAVPVEFRIAQLENSLERMREMPDIGQRYVLVNIPGYYLKAVDKDTTAITSRIIVGAPKNATPLFHRPITDVSFNPQWHVPARIARDEMMKKLRTNPDYFQKGNFIVKDHDGEIVNASEIDWDSQKGSYNFTQRAGDKNALGKVKFNLPDTDNIYLHSTANPKLFAKAERDLSHGCIRVEMARELAYFVMSGATGWSEERIAKLYDSSTSRVLKVEPVQVYLAYWTSWVDEKTKQPYFYPDIYGHDKKRVAELLSGQDSSKKDEMKVAMK